MSNIEGNIVTLIGKTYRNDNDSLSLTIPKEFAKELELGDSKVLMSVVENFDGERCLLITKLYREILIN